MKIALVHDYIKEYGGAERVLEALHELYPDAPVFTSLYLPEFLGPHKERFSGWNIKESWAKHIPFKEKLISPLRIISPLLFRSFDFSEYDVVIVSATGAYESNTINKKKFVHICYCHTPPRYLYGYATAREWKKNIIFRVLREIANHFLRHIDFENAKNVDYFIANSINVQKRIEKFYKRSSTVIYPPVENAPVADDPAQRDISSLRSSGEYYLAGGRLARPKHIDLIVKACQEHNLPLKVFGKGFAGYEKEIKGLGKALRDPLRPPRLGEAGSEANSKIEFLGEVSDEEKIELMKNAKAYIFASVDEDFGITPVEAMSVGTPVIAYRSGGVQESVIDGKTGIFFDHLTAEDLVKAIQKFNKVKIKAEDCVNQAKKFAKERFKTEIQTFIVNNLSSNR